MQKIKVLIADDHTMVRSGIRALLQGEPEIEVVGEATNGNEALELCRALLPNILLLDLEMPGLGGHGVLQALKASSLHVSTLILTMYDDEESLIKAMEFGAKGYVTKKAPENELIAAINAIKKGELYLDQQMAQKLLNKRLRENSLSVSKSEAEHGFKTETPLSVRETEVLRLIALGESDKGIAELLHISVKTVESHKSKIKEKLQMKRLAELVRYAVDIGLVKEE